MGILWTIETDFAKLFQVSIQFHRTSSATAWGNGSKHFLNYLPKEALMFLALVLLKADD